MSHAIDDSNFNPPVYQTFITFPEVNHSKKSLTPFWIMDESL